MTSRGIVTTVLVLVVIGGLAAVAQDRAAADAIFRRAVADFERGRIEQATAGFDQVAEMLPDMAPQLWQRGIALYYAGRYDDCRLMFESHRTVNPNDVENSVWHFLCVARLESPEAARTALLPVGRDSRVPMREIYEMFGGNLAPVQILTAAGSQLSGQFYAHLYLGLYFEAHGQDADALEHIEAAAADRFARVGGYMHMVARVHLALLQSQ